ncbi:MAG: cupin domain-containing protein [Pseudomonadota bacterium]
MSSDAADPTIQDAPAANPRNDIGGRIRARRKALGLTLQSVANDAGLTPGFISQVERGLAAPSISSLSAISKVLAVHPSELFQQPPTPGPLTRSGDRPRYRIAQGPLRYERLTSSFNGNVLRSMIIHEPPGHRSEPIRHEGEELFFILSGELTVEVDGTTHLLETGDSIHFASTRVHSSWNHTETTTTILHTCTMDVFGDAAPERRHLHDQGEPDDATDLADHYANQPMGNLP